MTDDRWLQLVRQVLGAALLLPAPSLLVWVLVCLPPLEQLRLITLLLLAVGAGTSFGLGVALLRGWL